MSLDSWDQITENLPPDDEMPLEERQASAGNAIGAVQAPGDDVRGESWRDLDLAGVIHGITTGTTTTPSPTLGRIDGAGFLLYVGMVHLIFGIGGALKTWLAAFLIAERLKAGEHVLFVDLEDRPQTLVERLMLDLEVPGDVIAAGLHYKRPSEPSTHGRDELLATVTTYAITLCVIDSYGESLAMDGINPNADEEVAVWSRMVARAIADAGAAVALLDHLPKSDELALTPIGSQRKQAAINGASYAMRIVKAPSRGVPGYANVVCGKDRQGAYGRGDVVAELHLEPRDGHTGVTLRTPSQGARGAGGGFRPTALMERASRAIEEAGEPLSLTRLRAMMGGKKDYADQAIEALIADGYVTRQQGERGAYLHALAAPYRQATDTASDAFIGTDPAGARSVPFDPANHDRDRAPSLGEGHGARSNDPGPGHGGGTVGHGQQGGIW
ncbi:AAA family ATPase [Demequina sp.]|uniref:AAA family ATPase n=1 Tax=Demequina sp. TaxID=2050685 RepID=UPI003D1272F0